MMIRHILLALLVGAGAAGAQNTFTVEDWTEEVGGDVQVDSTGALVLGRVNPEDNLALQKPAVDHTGQTARVTDGNFTRNSAWNSLTSGAFNFFVQVDLEEPRLVDRVVVAPVRDNDIDFMKGYSIQTSTDNIVFSEQVLNTRNLNNLIDTTFAPVTARYIRVQVKAIDRVHNVQMSELEVYGGGFLSANTVGLPVLDIGEGVAKNLGQVSWTADTPEGTSLTLQFRSGSTASPDGSWSDWTEPIDSGAGVLLDLPEPRRYLQYQVNLQTSDPGLAPRLQLLEIDLDEPLADGVSAEVVRDTALDEAADSLAVDEAPVGQARNFLYRAQVNMGAGTGFDVLRLGMPNRATVNFVRLDGQNLDGQWPTGEQIVDIVLDQSLNQDALIEIGFSIVLFDERNVFSGQVLDQNRPNNPQVIAPGDGRDESLAVFGVGLLERVLDKGAFSVTPNPFSPDGDQLFDRVQFSYELAKLSIERPVSLRIFDLTGRPVRRIDTMQKSGAQIVEWDGMDQEGEIVPPGLYLFQLDIDSGEGVSVNGTVGVSY